MFHVVQYQDWLIELKEKIRSTQQKAALAVNAALIGFYWELGRMISEKEKIWGGKLIEQIAIDLKNEFPDMKGFSRRNLFNAKKFFEFYHPALVQQPVALMQDDKSQQHFVQRLFLKASWSHNILIFTKCKNLDEAYFYLNQCATNHWSRENLALQIRSNLYLRQGKSVNNFKETLPESISELAEQALKDPYIFDFMAMSTAYRERDLERGLMEHVSKFLLELGKGFAFVGRQYHLEIGDNDYYIDLLFYHVRLKCYVVIELKNSRFIPEYAGKLNFYLSAVDSLLKQADDHPTIGIILCRDKNNIEAEFALRGIAKPMGVSEFEISTFIPEALKSSLPSIEELERGLNKPGL